MADDSSGREELATADNWDNFWSGSNASGETSWSKKRILDILDTHLTKGCFVLDAGCGSGFFSDYFNRMGAKTVSLDYSQTALSATKELTDGKSIAYIKDDLTDSELPSRSPARFDVIFSDGLFEHFGEREQDSIIKNMMSLLKPQGKIVTFVPNLFSLWTPLRPFLMPGIKEKPFTNSSLINLYKRNGCTIVSSGGINFIPVSWSPENLLARQFGMLIYAIGSPESSQ